jgi:hypothetical protein
MRDPDARRMMRELAMQYETLALRVENATLVCGLERPPYSLPRLATRNSKRPQPARSLRQRSGAAFSRLRSP